MSKKASRVFGLDVLRAVAVLLVLVGHSSTHQYPPHWFGWFWGAQGTLGVELFYVLSGFLIGHILIRSARSGRLHGAAAVWDFWERRWARTLPLYFFFVLLYLRFDYLGVGDLSKDYPFLFFMQNFAWPQLPFFQHSWSLAVEEWFYFLFPLVFLWFCSNDRAYRGPLLGTCAFFIAVPMLVRMAVARNVQDWAAFDANIRGVVICRLDSIFIGVLLAVIKLEWQAFYVRLRWLFPWALVFLLGMMFYLAYGLPGLMQNDWTKVLFFPGLSMVIAGLIPAMEQFHGFGWKPIDAFFTYTSKISYSLYLGHICMITLLESCMEKLDVRAAPGWSTLAFYALLFVAYYLFATLTYLFVERPYIALRDARMGHSDVRSGEVAVTLPVDQASLALAGCEGKPSA